MTADLIYIERSPIVRVRPEGRSIALNLELAAGFNHWLYGYVWDSLRKATFRTTAMYGLLEDAEVGLNQLCDNAGAIQVSLGLQARGDGAARSTAFLGGEDYASRAVAFSLEAALRQQEEPNCRWAQEKSAEFSNIDVADKLVLLNALSEEVLNGLRQVAAELSSSDSQDVIAAVRAGEAICQASLAVLWAISSAGDLAAGSLDAFLEILDDAVDRDIVLEAGGLAEQAMHGIWVRLHDEVSALERRQLVATA